VGKGKELMGKKKEGMVEGFVGKHEGAIRSLIHEYLVGGGASKG